MKALRNILIIASAFVMMLSVANAQRSKATNADIKARIMQNIAKSDNGDVVLNVKVKASKELINQTQDLPAPLLILLLYVDWQMDFDRFNKIMVKELDGKRLVTDILKATDKYLSASNMSLKEIKFSPNNARLKLDQGLPLFISLYSTNDYGKIAKRTETRKDATDVTAWKKSLNKLQVKSFSFDKKKVDFALVLGYNKITGEFLVLLNGKPYWFTESELKKAIYECHELRI